MHGFDLGHTAIFFASILGGGAFVLSILNRVPGMRGILWRALGFALFVDLPETRRKTDPPLSSHSEMRHQYDPEKMVTRSNCHTAMHEIDEQLVEVHKKIDDKFDALHEKVNATNCKIDELTGYIKGKFDK